MLASPAPDGARTAPAPGTRDWAPGAGARTGCCWPPDAAGRTCGAASSQSTRHAPGTSAPPPKTTPAPPTRRATARHTTASRPPSAPPRGNDASPSQHGTAPPPRATPHRASPAKAPSRPRSDAAPVQETCTATQAGSPPQRGSALKPRSLSQNKNPPCLGKRVERSFYAASGRGSVSWAQVENLLQADRSRDGEAPKSVGSNGETVFRLKGERAFEVDGWTFNRRCRLL